MQTFKCINLRLRFFGHWSAIYFNLIWPRGTLSRVNIFLKSLVVCITIAVLYNVKVLYYTSHAKLISWKLMPHITSWQWMDKSAFILLLMLCQLFLTTAASKWFADADFYVLLFNLLNPYFTINHSRRSPFYAGWK